MAIPSYQFLRNQTPAASLADAKAVLEGHVSSAIDGEIVLARYTDGNDVKTLMGEYYVSGSTKKVTITEPSADIIADINRKIGAISGTTSGETTGAAGKITVQFTQTSGKCGTITIANVYTANTATTYISGATSLQDADNKLDAEIKKLNGGTGITGSVDQKINSAITALDAGPFSGAGQVITAVKEVDGIVSATASTLPASSVSQSSTETIISSSANVQVALNAIANAADLEVVKRATPQSTNAQAEYYLAKHSATGTPIGEVIEIPKDSSLVNVTLGHVDDKLQGTTSQDQESTSSTIVAGTGATALDFVNQLANGKYKIACVDVSGFLDENEFASGVTWDSTAQKVRGVVDSNSEKNEAGFDFLSVGASGFKVDNIKREITHKIQNDIVSGNGISIAPTTVDSGITISAVAPEYIDATNQVYNPIVVNSSGITFSDIIDAGTY